MEGQPQPCPYRYLYLGRSFCALAIVESRFALREVFPETCGQCEIPEVIAEHPCGRMDLGVEISAYGGRPSVGVRYTSCEVTVERLFDVSGCHREGCPFWQPLGEEKQREIREAARQRLAESS